MCDRPSADAIMIAGYASELRTGVKQMTSQLALAGMACLLPLMSPGCSSLTGCRILRLDFAASGTPPPPWPGKTGQSAIEIPKCVNAAVPLLACEGRQGGAGTSGGARSRRKDTGACRAAVSGGHERSRLARRRLDRRGKNQRNHPDQATTVAIKNIAITLINTWPRGQFVQHRKIASRCHSTSAGRAPWFCAR